MRHPGSVHLLLLDSASLYWRAFHALPDSIVDGTGRPMNAVRGFLDTVARLVEDRHPDRVIACWDVDWRPQWRVDLLPTYKTHRVETEDQDSRDTEGEEMVPDTLGPQIPVILDLLEALGIEVLGAPDCEADDVIATVALRHGALGDRIDIASGDRDLVQLVSDAVSLLYTGGTSASRGGAPWVVYDPRAVVDTFGVAPDQYPLMASLRGDPSDGIPGLAGIGAKTAVALVTAYGDLPGLLSAAEADPVRPMTARLSTTILEGADTLAACLAVTLLEQRSQVPLVDSPPQADMPRALQIARQHNVERAAVRLARAVHGADE